MVLNACPEASRAIGSVLVSVIPGDTLTSRKYAVPPSSTIRSVRDRSRSPSTECAAMAIRVNPEIGAGGHDKISTGHAASKFGVSFGEAARLYAKASNIAEPQQTSFLLNYRHAAPIPDLMSICQFLCTSLTFVGLQHIEQHLNVKAVWLRTR